MTSCPRCGSPAHRDCRRRSWPWALLVAAALFAGLAPSIIVGLSQ